MGHSWGAPKACVYVGFLILIHSGLRERPSGVIKPPSVLRYDSLKIPLARQPVQSAAVRFDVIEVAQPVY